MDRGTVSDELSSLIKVESEIHHPTEYGKRYETVVARVLSSCELQTIELLRT